MHLLHNFGKCKYTVKIHSKTVFFLGIAKLLKLMLLSQGGLKAVVWTDTLQTVLMYFGVLFVLIYGTWRLGGVRNVFAINDKGDRLDIFK